MTPNIIDIEFLNKDELYDIKTKVFLLKDHWVALSPKEDKIFDSIVTRMMPAGTQKGGHQSSTQQIISNNKLMNDYFSVYYNKIKEKLSLYYKTDIHYQNNFQLPGFHIFVTNNVKNVSYTSIKFHQDGYKNFPANKVDSIVIPISLPKLGGSLLFNDPPEIFPYKEGMLGIWPGNLIHTIEPFTFADSSECRITMQMHTVILLNNKRIVFW